MQRVGGPRSRAAVASSWAGTTGSLGEYIKSESRRTLSAYRRQPTLVTEHANLEIGTAGGGYADRQLVELIQNSADALVGLVAGERGRISIRLTDDCLYCADDGDEMDEDGARALMFSHLSPKRRESEIGRFGLGFKAVLGVSDAPEFFSRSGSFRFDRGRTADRIRKIVPDQEAYPALRLAAPIDPRAAARRDRILAEEMVWARNIVRLPLLASARGRLEEQMRSFPAPFLLFVEHVRRLSLSGHREEEVACEVVERDGGECVLRVNDQEQRWIVFRRRHRLSAEAVAEWSLIRDREAVPLSWAFPQDAKQRAEHSHFWAYFRTRTESLVPGILNAPWKTNEDRQNLLPGAFNRDLIEASADLIVAELKALRTADDPARHLEALPRRHAPGDSEESDRIRECLSSRLQRDPIVPDQKGVLRRIEALQYPPKEAPTEALDRWADCALRPTGWPHPSVARGNRLAKIEHLWLYRRDRAAWAAYRGRPTDLRMPTASSREWLGALFKKASTPADLVEASRSAVQVAALMPRVAAFELGKIVLTVSGGRAEPDPERVFLPAPGEKEQPTLPGSFVHPELIGDDATRAALEKLGIGEPPPDVALRVAVREIASRAPGDSAHQNFWSCVRESLATGGLRAVTEILGENEFARRHVRIRTASGAWQTADRVLLPGKIVPAGVPDDADVVVDTDYHREEELPLLADLGVVAIPQLRDPGTESWFASYESRCVERFRAACAEEGGGRPRSDYLVFRSPKGPGPLTVLPFLSPESAARYTDALLRFKETYRPWKMRHRSDLYSPRAFTSPALKQVERHGRIRTPAGSVPFADALGESPRNEDALRALLEHPQGERIRKAFELADVTPEVFGESEPEPLLDCWPGLDRYLVGHRKDLQLTRCDRIVSVGEKECVLSGGDIFLVPTGDEFTDLGRVVEALGVKVAKKTLRRIAERVTTAEVEKRRHAVQAQDTDAARLLVAVGHERLRRLLPGSLVAHLEEDGFGGGLSPGEVAEAAIAVFHAETLWMCRDTLTRLAPPKQWAGSGRAVAFVKSLGFSAEWAGERNRKREPYLEVEGRFRLPRLHRYQKDIVRNVLTMLRDGHAKSDARRGMISLPTGSGKTRVAVQAAVRALTRNDLGGGVLWVADRDELCEQAVEAWQQVWSAKGAPGTALRISRLWGGQPGPSPTSDPHVVVASIQTLQRRLERYPFLRDFGLVVFDEAHRSLARSFTSVMAELGLRYRKRADEPYLLGLTATPYRGYNEEETQRLAKRYGARRLDRGVFPDDDPESAVKFLQQKEVLAEADQETIEGVAFEMTPEEERELEALPSWLPEQLEKRIGRDSERTERIVDAFLSRRDTAGPTLIFATSVEHADTVSGILNLRGVRSRAVNGGTNRGTRRRIVEQFRAGEIDVLVNYGVFREGFDAPKTRTIIVARPVYSPNLYFQMIGRGLRGEKNRGNPRCLILNVEDNIVNFDRKLAFSELDWLWAPDA